jgi:hypothetical protein
MVKETIRLHKTDGNEPGPVLGIQLVTTNNAPGWAQMIQIQAVVPSATARITLPDSRAYTLAGIRIKI